MTLSAGTSGRLPVLSTHVQLAAVVQVAAQVAWKTCADVGLVEPLNPPTATKSCWLFVGWNATPLMERFGRTAFASVMSVQAECGGAPPEAVFGVQANVAIP